VKDLEPVPHRTLKVLMHMPTVFLGMAAVMGGVYWVIERRQKLMNETGDPESLTQQNDDAPEDSSSSEPGSSGSGHNSNGEKEG
jgi:hypothetical protein